MPDRVIELVVCAVAAVAAAAAAAAARRLHGAGGESGGKRYESCKVGIGDCGGGSGYGA